MRKVVVVHPQVHCARFEVLNLRNTCVRMGVWGPRLLNESEKNVWGRRRSWSIRRGVPGQSAEQFLQDGLPAGQIIGFGDIHVPKPLTFIGFIDILGTKPYRFIGFGGIHGPKPYKLIGFGDIHGPEPSIFIGFGDNTSLRRRGLPPDRWRCPPIQTELAGCTRLNAEFPGVLRRRCRRHRRRRLARGRRPGRALVRCQASKPARSAAALVWGHGCHQTL